MTTSTDVAHRLYEAMADADATALLNLLTEDFEGMVSAGMPHGVGGDHHGAADMVVGVWGTIAALYEIRVEPIEYLEVNDHRVVVVGRYQGRSRADTTEIDAAFAHVITTRGEHVAALQQITDTARWRI